MGLSLAALELPSAGALVWLAGAAVAAGLARGFSGFGTALIFVPIAAMVVGPVRAVPLMTAIDLFAVAAMTHTAWNLADRREVGLLALGAAAGVPLGAAMLLHFEALTLRWIICLLIALLLALLASGWRLRHAPSPGLSVAVGMAGGAMSGIAMIGGPPVMVYLLGQGAGAQRIRAVFTLYVAAGTGLAALTFALAGLMGLWLAGLLVVTVPGYLAGLWGGVRLFGLASEATFRRATYAMICFAVVVSMPALDAWLRS